MKKIILLSLVLAPAMLLASGGHDSEVSRYLMQTGRENDFWPRVINFTIWVSLLYYLVANPLKSYFNNRSDGIAEQLNEIEKKLQLAKNEQKEAQIRLEKSTQHASQIVEDAKNEALLLADKITQANEQELLLMEKQLEEKISLEERKSARAIIDTVLNESLSNSDILLDSEKVVDIIGKKVA